MSALFFIRKRGRGLGISSFASRQDAVIWLENNHGKNWQMLGFEIVKGEWW